MKRARRWVVQEWVPPGAYGPAWSGAWETCRGPRPTEREAFALLDEVAEAWRAAGRYGFKLRVAAAV